MKEEHSSTTPGVWKKLRLLILNFCGETEPRFFFFFFLLLSSIHLLFMSSFQSRFSRALTVVDAIPQNEVGFQPAPTDRLKFYGLYKQATLGECNIPKPSSRKIIDYAKW